ncbi:outer dynein arm-docking complex subunit 1 [Tribolium castaneum]|nr:PREDICTED: coiled-coil domain-containing protein 63 isoform X1 [Tribolium castaneum]|eukprot:XP_015836480.1 PREDICTED: coiled-coil domain-containing protein 63 isoform X1 [Tribolium castaneum]
MDKMRNPMPADQLDMEMMAEAELARLQRQYRIMEGDRKAFLDEVSNKLKKQRKIITRLRKERDDLMADIKVATCDGQKRKDSKISAKLELLLQKHEEIVAQVQKEKFRLEELEQQIRKTEKQVRKLRLKDVTEGEYQERIKSGQKSVKMLENKLETTHKRFCSVLTENKQMRDEIDHLLKERTRFNAIWEKLVFDLNMGKKYMLDLIEQATLAYDQREEWCSKLQALKIRAHNDVITHTQEMREMQRQLDHDGNLREFLTIKGQKRVMKDLEEKEMKKKEQERENLQKQIKIYQETLDKIKTFCEEEDVERIAAKYLKQEEENFALFNYVNELNHELETLSDSIEELEGKINEQKQICEQKAQKEKDSLESLKRALEEATQQANQDEANLAQTEEDLRLILKGIKDVFELVECDCAPILDLLGENPDVNEDNALIYLGLIEKKVSSLITTAYFKEKSVPLIFIDSFF